MLNERLNRFKFDSTPFQQAFNIFSAFNNVGQPLQMPQHLVQQSVERMLKPNIETGKLTDQVRHQTRAQSNLLN